MPTLEVRTSIDEIPPSVFDSFEASRRYPFLRRDWLLALERAGVELLMQNLPGTWPVELIAAEPPTALELVRPQVYVKGGDYDIETLEETRRVRSWGGSAVALPFVDGYSTTALVRHTGACSAIQRSPSAARPVPPSG